MNSEKAQVFEGILSVVINAILFAVKLWVGMVTGSIALVADAWHTMSDSATSIFVVFAAKLAAKKADKEHPFGHGRWELITSLLIAGVLVMIGYEFLTNSIERFKNRESVIYGTLAIAITIVSIIVKEILTQVAFYLGKKYKNAVITADGWHHRSDSLSSVVVLAGIVVTQFTSNLWWMDSVLGAFCAFAIFYVSYKIMAESITKLLGEAPDQNFIDELKAEVSKVYDKELHLHHIHLHNYITHRELTLHMRLDQDLTIEVGHKIATDVENMIKERFHMETTIHVEPSKIEDRI
jgi:cation diffusion facilitator family transporter